MKSKDFVYSMDETGVIISFDNERNIISSAPYNGGLCHASHIYNYRITFEQEKEYRSIDDTYKQLKEEKKLEGNMVGLMTSARLESFVNFSWESKDFNATLFLSAGLSNAMCAGDEIGKSYFAGTINTILILKEEFSQSALVEAIMILTESKIAAMQDLGITSYTSGKKATGTGTDAVLVANGSGKYIEYCGKHTAVGRDIARLFKKAFNESVTKADLLNRKPFFG